MSKHNTDLAIRIWELGFRVQGSGFRSTHLKATLCSMQQCHFSTRMVYLSSATAKDGTCSLTVFCPWS